MWESILSILLVLVKWIFEKMADKKLNNKEFLQYVSAYQKKNQNNGQTSLDWEEALKKAQEEMK